MEDIADDLAGRRDILRAREEVLSKLMVCFENGQSAKQVLNYFLDPTKKAESPKVIPVKTPISIKKVIPIKKASANKKAKKKLIDRNKKSIK